MGRIARAGLVATVLLAAIVPTVASAQGTGAVPTHREFVAAADRICEQPYRKALRRLYYAGRLYDRGKYVKAGKKLVRSGTVVLSAIGELRGLERPPADADRIERWLDKTERGLGRLVKAGKAMRRERLKRAHRMQKRANRTVRRAKRIVHGFGFQSCA
jgi:hypothetical protein